MRLLLCILISCLLHTGLLYFRASPLSVPAVSVGLSHNVLHVQVQQLTRSTPVVKQSAATPEPKPEPEPTPKPVKKIKPASTPKTSVPQPKAAPEPTAAKPESSPAPISAESGSYSSAKTEPRMIEQTEYLTNPPPVYPRSARRRGYEGTVLILVHVTRVGTVSKITIQDTSGYAELDKAAIQAVSKWKFNPSTINGTASNSIVLVPIQFTLR